ncbi:MAG: N-acetyltransferase family protein [Eubacteriales bacterium]
MLDTVKINHVQHISFTQSRLTDAVSVILSELLSYEHPSKEEGIFLAEIDGEVVGTATGYFNGDGKSGTVHMVSVLDKARGRKLGRAVCGRVLQYLKENGCTQIVLTTDDFRIPAIKTYLSLGFQPVQNNEEMRRRWGAILSRLGEENDA